MRQVLVVSWEIFSCRMQTLSWGMWDLVPWPVMEPRPHPLGAWSLSHRTTREVPSVVNFSAVWHYFLCYACYTGFPGGSDGEESACNAEDLGLITGLGRSPGEGCGNPLQYSCLRNPTDRGAWWAIVHGVTKESDMNEWLTHMLVIPSSIESNSVKKLYPGLRCAVKS